ncbi:protein O-mannosyl-transferase family [Aquimarina sp. LLG6339-5]|uniref:protein O-mannosyl-transferase family n=1 Tax=Aquimarina sp. LLG6339-5 TaxID=3160830 RepID=UPI003870A78F
MKKTERILGWILFGVVFIIYSICSPKTITFWDSAEFISSNYKLQATHPPGTPFYTLLSNVLLSVFPTSVVALISNLISSLFGALTVTCVYFLTKKIATKLIKQTDEIYAKWLPSISGILSGLTLAFIHSFWIASTETEVYTLSFLLLVLIWYIAILWQESDDSKTAFRLLLLIGLLLGISAGVHLINLSLVIPLSIIFVYKKYTLSIKNISIGLVAGIMMFFGIYGITIQGFLKVAHHLDVYLVNDLNASMNTGLIALCLLLIGALASLTVYARKKSNILLHTISLFTLFFYIGISSYGISVIRANAKTSVSNGPINSIELLSYIRAEQFGLGGVPLVRGHFYNAPLDSKRPFVDGNPILRYNPVEKQYIEVDDGFFSQENYAREFSTFFPRMYSRKRSDISGYNSWTAVQGEPVSYSISGKTETLTKPTLSENLGFFYNYQVHWLYLRYLCWNFVGKQNDYKGTGTILNGNWISGINAIDKSRIGDINKIPDYYKNDSSKDAYYFLPFILGIVGLFLLRKSPVHLFTSLLFFLTFGIGIIIYVNPTPTSILIRERDYIFVASFIPFCMWIGLSVIQLYRWFSFISQNRIRLTISAVLISIASPIQLFAKGWDDHSRNSSSFAYSFAKSYLDSCPQNTVLITNGDNMTFPLWYLQEVENYRTDIRIINFDQLTLGWYIEKLKLKMNTSDGLNISIPSELYQKGPQSLLPLKKETDQPADVNRLFKFLSDPKTQIPWNGKKTHYIPSQAFSLSVDTTKFAKNLYLRKQLNLQLLPKVNWKLEKDFYAVNDLTLLNIIQENIHQRPIAFVINGNTNHYIGLKQFTIQRGFIDLLAPVRRAKPGLNPKIVDTQMMYPFITEKVNFEGLNDPEEFIDDEEKVYASDILRRSYYFLAQALLEENRPNEAIKILDKCTTQFPNKTILFKQYAFALGKLYFKAGNPEKGNDICLKSIKNLENELIWLISFDPPNPIINVKYATRVKNMYFQMLNQYNSLNPNKTKKLKEDYQKLESSYKMWYSNNWPY